MDLTELVADVGTDGPVTIAGLGTRGGAVPRVRAVRPPAGIDWIQADEMVAACGAGTPLDELAAALAEHGQRVALPAGGTVGGALAAGHGSVRALGDGPLRDVLLQAHYVSAAGEVVKAGGPTVKNVSGFDLCRLLVGSNGTLGFLGDVILRTRPLPTTSQWFEVATTDPWPLFRRLYRPASVLWDGATLWALLEGHPADVAQQAAGMEASEGPPALPAHRHAGVGPAELADDDGRFVAALGTGLVWRDRPARVDDTNAALVARIKTAFDPAGRLNPGR
jgi:glycolate oxidase FAD binding subunit